MPPTTGTPMFEMSPTPVRDSSLREFENERLLDEYTPTPMLLVKGKRCQCVSRWSKLRNWVTFVFICSWVLLLAAVIGGCLHRIEKEERTLGNMVTAVGDELIQWPVHLEMLSGMLNLQWLTALPHTSRDAHISSEVTKQPPNLEWWQKTIIYQVYPRSFQDSDGDGVGDLKGVESRLQYIKDLGVDSVWLSPIYASPMRDFGYDVKDYRAIDPIFGTMKDFDSLIAEIHKKDMYLIMDFIPNHSSNDSEWFQRSRRAKDPSDPYYSYYVWRDCDHGRALPTNWLSLFGGPAWTYDPVRDQCYLHQYLESQPDVDWRNPLVQKEYEDILRFWLDKGVDGFRVDAILHMFEDYLMRNESIARPDFDPNRHEYLNHTMTEFMPEIHDMVARWRNILDEKSQEDGRYKFMVTEAYGNIKEIRKFYGKNGRDSADMPFNFGLVFVSKNCGGTCIHGIVDEWLSNVPDGKWSNWVTGNHDNSRIATKMGKHFVNAMNTLLLLLPGTPTTYYGEELGMTDIYQRYPVRDPFGARYPDKSRDPERSPMQWVNDSQSGFTTNNNSWPHGPWLPLNPDYQEGTTVEDELQDSNSHLNVYKSLAKLRQEPAFQYGDFRYAVVMDYVFSFVREWPGKSSYLVAINFGSEKQTVDFTNIENIPVDGLVVETTRQGFTFQKGDIVSLGKVQLSPGQGIVVTWKP